VAECGACRNDEPGFDAARNYALYTGKLRQAVLRLKFAGDHRLGVRLGELLALPWERLPGMDGSGSPLIIPVPLHSSRRRERGFNQSELLATGLAHTLGKVKGKEAPRVETACFCRKRDTPPQTGLSVAGRRENLRGAFEVAKPATVRGRRIVLVDDVMTTGATLSACARTLKRAGAAQVMGITLARATPQFPDLSPPEADNTVDGLAWDST
jgi:ComF family protein